MKIPGAADFFLEIWPVLSGKKGKGIVTFQRLIS